MIKPISNFLLIHTCLLKKPLGLDRNRNPTFSIYVLKKVRIGVSLQSVRGDVAETKADTMTLYIDATNTIYETTDGVTLSPFLEILPNENDVVEWENKNFTVRKITPCFTRSIIPHHWEIELE